MFIHSFTMLPWWLFFISLYSVSTVKIGQISHGIYVPQPVGTNASYMFHFSMSCNECLCYALSSNISYVAINCISNTQWCSFYTDFSTDYSFEWNVDASVYFFQPFPTRTTAGSIISTALPLTTMTTATTSRISTSEFLLMENKRPYKDVISEEFCKSIQVSA